MSLTAVHQLCQFKVCSHNTSTHQICTRDTSSNMNRCEMKTNNTHWLQTIIVQETAGVTRLPLTPVPQISPLKIADILVTSWWCSVFVLHFTFQPTLYDPYLVISSEVNPIEHMKIICLTSIYVTVIQEGSKLVHSTSSHLVLLVWALLLVSNRQGLKFIIGNRQTEALVLLKVISHWTAVCWQSY